MSEGIAGISLTKNRRTRTYFHLKLIPYYMASPFVAAVLSFFIPGLGQFYTGQLTKAILLFIAAVIFGILSWFLIGIPFYIIVWIYSMVDAYNAAKESGT